MWNKEDLCLKKWKRQLFFFFSEASYMVAFWEEEIDRYRLTSLSVNKWWSIISLLEIKMEMNCNNTEKTDNGVDKWEVEVSINR